MSLQFFYIKEEERWINLSYVSSVFYHGNGKDLLIHFKDPFFPGDSEKELKVIKLTGEDVEKFKSSFLNS